MSEAITFTWRTPDGQSYEVTPIRDIDEWTGREMRALDRIAGGTTSGISDLAFSGLMFALSLARVVPGLSIEAADAELTVGRVREINRQLRDRRTAAAATEEEPAEEAGTVLSPTQPADGAKPAAASE